METIFCHERIWMQRSRASGAVHFVEILPLLCPGTCAGAKGGGWTLALPPSQEHSPNSENKMITNPREVLGSLTELREWSTTSSTLLRGSTSKDISVSDKVKHGFGRCFFLSSGSRAVVFVGGQPIQKHANEIEPMRGETGDASPPGT